MRTILSPEEMARADRFFMEVIANRFIAGRALLRDLLAGYLGQPPEAIRFAYNEWGKPALAAGFRSARPALQPVTFAGSCDVRVRARARCRRRPRDDSRRGCERADRGELFLAIGSRDAACSSA